MRYICTRDWRDLTDKHLYHEGDPFPFDGREVPAERLKELESGSNRAGLQMIQGAADQKAPEEKPAPEAAEEAKPEAVTEAKPKARKPRKTKAQE